VRVCVCVCVRVCVCVCVCVCVHVPLYHRARVAVCRAAAQRVTVRFVAAEVDSRVEVQEREGGGGVAAVISSSSAVYLT